MKASHELTNDLLGVISIEVEVNDYQPKVDKVLKDYKKRAQVPGFRPGHVPMGLVKKMYGNNVLAEELNRMLLEELDRYIKESGIEMLGNPLPVADDQIKLDINTPADHTFKYDVAIAPQFEAEVSEKDKFTYYTVNIDDALIDKYTNDLRRRYGKVGEIEVAKEDDMLQGTFTQLDENGEVLANGVSNNSTIALEFLENNKAKKQLVGAKAGDSFDVNPADVSKGHDDMARMLGISHEEVHAVEGSTFRFEVEKVYEMTPADLTQDFYDQIFGKEAVDSEESFRTRVKEELTKTFGRDSDFLLIRHVQDSFMEKLNLELPDEFLKRWLMASNEKPVTMEQINAEYDEYAKGLRWQLIENKLVNNLGIKVQPEELQAAVEANMRVQFERYGYTPDEETMNSAVQRAMQDEEQVRQVYRDIVNQALLNAYKETYKLKEKQVDFDEFVKLATGEPAKKGILSNLTNLFN